MEITIKYNDKTLVYTKLTKVYANEEGLWLEYIHPTRGLVKEIIKSNAGIAQSGRAEV